MVNLYYNLKSLCIFKNIVDDEGVSGLIRTLNPDNTEQFLGDYSQIVNSLINYGNFDLADYIIHLLRADENVFSVSSAAQKQQFTDNNKTMAEQKQTLTDKIPDADIQSQKSATKNKDLAVQKQNLTDKSQIDFDKPNIMTVASRDLAILSELSKVNAKAIKIAAKKILGDVAAISSLPEWYSLKNIPSAEELSEFYNKNGYGIFTQSYAYSYSVQTGEILPINAINPIRLADLKEYESEKQEVLANTNAFIKGLPANNVLLYGDRGTGKSSTVHAILNEKASEGLRLLEVTKDAIPHFSKIINKLRRLNLKFIIFLDDLTFIEGEDDYAQLKAALEGSISKLENVLIYATTNRRHLLKESSADREGSDIHVKDTMEEQLSLSDRFGLVVTFITPDKREFLCILKQILSDRGIVIGEDELSLKAERYALKKGGRSPRAAMQLAKIIESEGML